MLRRGRLGRWVALLTAVPAAAGEACTTNAACGVDSFCFKTGSSCEPCADDGCGAGDHTDDSADCTEACAAWPGWPKTPGWVLGETCKDSHPFTEYDVAPERDGAMSTWTGSDSVHDPTKLVLTEDGTLVTFGSGQAGDGNAYIMTKYLPAGTTEWLSTPPMYVTGGGPGWVDGVGLGDTNKFDAPGVLYSGSRNRKPYKSLADGEAREWVMYYSYYVRTPDVDDSVEDTGQACIGRATGSGAVPEIAWVDDGTPVLCSNAELSGDYDAVGTKPESARYGTLAEWGAALNDLGIDPALLEETGADGKATLYMSWGSGLIYGVFLDPATGRLPKEAQPFLEPSTLDSGVYALLSRGAYNEEWFNEAPFITRYEHTAADGTVTPYHYLWVNWFSCCSGKCSKYEIRVGRSTKGAHGPYLDKAGQGMAEEGQQTVYLKPAAGGEPFLRADMDGDRIIGPGHAGVLEYMKDDARQYVFSYHYYNGRHSNGLTMLGAQGLSFVDGSDGPWPVLAEGDWDPAALEGATPIASPLAPTPTPPTPAPPIPAPPTPAPSSPPTPTTPTPGNGPTTPPAEPTQPPPTASPQWMDILGTACAALNSTACFRPDASSCDKACVTAQAVTDALGGGDAAAQYGCCTAVDAGAMASPTLVFALIAAAGAVLTF